MGRSPTVPDDDLQGEPEDGSCVRVRALARTCARVSECVCVMVLAVLMVWGSGRETASHPAVEFALVNMSIPEATHQYNNSHKYLTSILKRYISASMNIYVYIFRKVF